MQHNDPQVHSTMTEPPAVSALRVREAVQEAHARLSGDKAQCGSELSASDITDEVRLSARFGAAQSIAAFDGIK